MVGSTTNGIDWITDWQELIARREGDEDLLLWPRCWAFDKKMLRPVSAAIVLVRY